MTITFRKISLTEKISIDILYHNQDLSCSMKINKLHEWNLTYKEAVVLQQRLAHQLTFPPVKRAIRYVAGVDISYSRGDDRLFSAVVVMDIENFKIVEVASHISRAIFPYIPGFLAFREIPPLLEAFKKLQRIPDIVLCDGQGIAHPRKMGLASHLGLWLALPTIGCAKTRLVGEYGALAIDQWAETPLIFQNEQVGTVVRTKRKVKPLFISPGHLIDLESSLVVVKRCVTHYRLPELIRQAHLNVNDLRRNISDHR